MPTRVLKQRAKPKAQPRPTVEEPPPVEILTRVKVRSFTQARAVASKILKGLINGTIPSERVRWAVPLLQVIVSCNQSVLIRQRLDRLQQALQLNLGDDGQAPEEEPLVEGAGCPEAGTDETCDVLPAEAEEDDEPEERDRQI